MLKTIDETGAPPALDTIKGDGPKVKALEDFWSARQLMASPSIPSQYLTLEELERHQMYVFLVMSLVRHYMNGNKKGPKGDYNYRPDQRDGSTGYFDQGKDYLGHNIAAIAVDGRGKVVDFDFNHNEVFRSSLEHAEARLMRRIFSLTGLPSTWELGEKTGREPASPATASMNYSTMLTDVTVYTTVEPCAQCIGIMALGKVKNVVFVQPDDGTRRVANILFHVEPYGAKVLPVAAARLGVPIGQDLANAFSAFAAGLSQKPFWKGYDAQGNPKVDDFPSLVTFLCTDGARRLYDDAVCRFETRLSEGPRFPDYPDADNDPLRPEDAPARLTNQQVFEEVECFLKYARNLNHRGTPH